MSRAYIILAHQYPVQLGRLVHALAADDAHILVHIDRKTDDSVYSEMVQLLGDYDRLHFLRRHVCYWGGFGHVRATLEGIDALFEKRLPFSHVLLLTGQDYPIAPSGQLADFLTEHATDSFMEYENFPMSDWRSGGYPRIENYHVRYRDHYRHFRGRRTFPMGFTPVGGAAYWCLSHACAEYIRSFVKSNRKFTRFFRYVFAPDEIFFHTILLNSPLRDTIVNRCLTYIDWSRANAKGNPLTLTEADFGALCPSAHFFARKFDATVDSAILDLIDKKVADLQDGAAQESNLPSRGLHDLTGFEDRLRHRPLPLRDQPIR